MSARHAPANGGGARRIAVTGAAGFIGSRVCAILKARGHTVTGLVRLGSAPPRLDVPVVGADLSDSETLASLLGELDVEAVCHCAWVGHPRSAGSEYREQALLNVEPGLHLGIAAGLAPIQHLLFISSGGGLNASSGARRPGAYGWAKRTVEAALAAAAHDFGFELTVLRPSPVFGPGQDPAKGLGVVTVFLTRILEGKPLHILGSPGSGRDFLHVDDLADCVSALIEQRVPGTFEAGGPEVVTLDELVKMLEAASGRSADLRLDDATGFDAELTRLDNSPLTAATGWIPRRGLLQALPELMFETAALLDGGSRPFATDGRKSR